MRCGTSPPRTSRRRSRRSRCASPRRRARRDARTASSCRRLPDRPELVRVVRAERAAVGRRALLHLPHALGEVLVRAAQRRRGVALLVLLDLLPLREHVALDGLALEDVGVTAHELLREPRCDLAEIEAAVLPRELRVDHDLEEEIAELLAQHRGVPRVESLEDLVRLLEHEWPEARVGLLARSEEHTSELQSRGP